MRLAIDAGSALENDTQDGGAHFLEHMLFNGTEEFPENELIAVLRSFGAGFGADINAYTSYDETVYQLTMPTEDPAIVATGLDVLEQWLSAATIDQAQVEAERGVVLDEWRGVSGDVQRSHLRRPRGAVPVRIALRGQGPDRVRHVDHHDERRAAASVLRRLVPARQHRGRGGRRRPGHDRGRHRRTLRPDRGQGGVARSSRTDRRTVDGTTGVDPRRPRRGRGVRPGHAAAGVHRDGLGRSGLPELDPRLDGLRHRRHPPRQRRAARRGPVRRRPVDSSGFVRGLDAPEIIVSADGDSLEASAQAVFDEYGTVSAGFSDSPTPRSNGSSSRTGPRRSRPTTVANPARTPTSPTSTCATR